MATAERGEVLAKPAGEASKDEPMTEQEWLSCEAPLPMLIFLRGEAPEPREPRGFHARIMSGYGDLYPGAGDKISPRKVRLFIAACLQRLRTIPFDEPSLKAVGVYTRYASDKCPREEFDSACMSIYDVIARGGEAVVSHLAGAMWTDEPSGAASASLDIACRIAGHVARDSVAVTCAGATEDDWFAWGFCGGPPDALWQATRQAEEKYQAALLRHIVGNPFRPTTVDSSWLHWNGGAVLALAQGISDEWACTRMPILADALEEAGCTDQNLLAHLRGPGPHVRGCWALDALLGNE